MELSDLLDVISGEPEVSIQFFERVVSSVRQIY